MRSLSQFISILKKKGPKRRISIGFFPAGNKFAASSRIRVYSLLPSLDTLHIKYFINPPLVTFYKYNTMFIQKRITKKILMKARLAKILKRRIIYDIDDFGSALLSSASPAYVKKMMMLADLITTGSDAQKEILETEYLINKVRVLPALVDYFPEEPVQNIAQFDEPLRVIWFGVWVNFPTFAKYIETLQQIRSIKIVVVTNREKIGELSEEYPFIHFEAWSLETFIPILRSCHLSILTHDGSLYDQAKTNNKMIASITWGVPAIVSNTPEYFRTAKKAGIDYTVFSNADELVSIIERLRMADARQDYLERAQPIIWQEYSPAAVARRFVTICNEIKPSNFWVGIKNLF